MIAFLAYAAITADTPGLATFSGKMIGVGSTVTIGRLSGDGAPVYWFRATPDPRYRDAGILWTDTRRCPDARAVIDGLGALTPQSQREPPFAGIDEVSYTLERNGGAPGGAVRLSGSSRTAFGQWAQSASKTLRSCWSDAAPED